MSRSRRAAGVVLLAALVAVVVGLVGGASGATPAATSVAVAPSDPSLSTPPAASEPDLGEEVPSARTASSRTFRTPDGRMVTRLYPQPVNFRDRGGWRAIDTTLVPADRAGYVHPRANDGDVLVPQSLVDPFIVSRGGDSVRFTLQSQSGQAQVNGDEATFRSAGDGVDAAYRATTTGVKETLTLNRADAQHSFVYDVSASAGLAPRHSRDGSIVFADPQGHDRFVFRAPLAWDSATPASVSHAAALAIAPVQGGWRLTLDVDATWLASPRRQFPVTVDPNVQWITGGTMRYSGAQRDCTLSSATPSTSLCSDPDLKVGSDAAGTYKALLFFDARSAIPQDSTIYSAQLLAHVGGSGTAPASNLRVRRITSSWTNAATWSTRDGSAAWGTAGGDVGSGTDDVGSPLSVSGLNNWYQFPVPAGLVQSWIWGDNPDYGLQLSADAGSPAQVYSLESTEGDPNKWPALDLYWWEDQGSAGFYTLDRQQLSDSTELAVNVANGQMSVTANELDLPGTAGLDLGITRVWQSVRAYDQANFALGWYLGYDETWTHDDADGSVFYIDMTGHHSRFAPAGTGTYLTPSGVNATLCKIGVATGCTSDGLGTGYKYRLTENKSGRKYYYSNGGRIAAIKDRNNNTITFDWQTSTATIHGTQGRAVTISIDASGYMTSLTDGTRTASYTRDANNMLATSTDLGGKTWHYEYDSDGNLTKITDPLGHETRIEWQSVPDFGSWRATKVIRVLDATDPTNPLKNPTTTYSYDPANHTTVVTNPVGNSTTSDPNDGQTTYHYDKQLRVTKATNPKGLDTATTWTDNSDVNTFSDLSGTANAGLATMTYDSAGLGNLRQVDQKVTSSTTATATFDYYGSGAFPQSQYAVKRATNFDGQPQYFAYDGTGNLTSIKDGDPSDPRYTTARNQVTLGYGSSGVDGTVRSATDGNGNTTTFSYTNSQLTKISPPAADVVLGQPLGETAITYDGLGRVQTVTDGNGIVHTFSYDAMDRVTRDEVNATTYITYTWDADGNLTQRHEVNGTTSTTTDYGYDNLNRRTSETFPAYTDTYTYNLNSQLATLTDPSGTTTYSYDELDRVRQITDPQSAQVAYSYTDTTNPRSQTITFPASSMTQTTEYDLAGKPTHIYVKSGTTERLRRDYTYGTAGTQISSVTDETGAHTDYTYGQDGELKTAKTYTAGGTLTTDRSYSYDKATNRLTTTTAGSGTTTYTYNTDNQLCWRYSGTSNNTCASAPSGAQGYTYDKNGNQLTGGPGGSYTYDPWNRLTTIGTTNLGYLSPTNNELISYGTTTYTNNALGLSSQTTGTAHTYYVRDPRGRGVAQRRYTGTSPVDTDYLATDALGSTIGLINGTSTSPVRTYTYDPDGNATSSGTGPTTDLRFAGGYVLAAGLYHYGARYYDPNAARWTQQDPINQISSVTEANRYSYVGDDPVNAVDLVGLRSAGEYAADCIKGGATDALVSVAGGATAGAAGGAALVGCGTEVGADLADDYVGHGAGDAIRALSLARTGRELGSVVTRRVTRWATDTVKGVF